MGNYTAQDAEDMLNVFYSCLYRASLFPRLLYEVDDKGKAVHYSPYDKEGRTFDGVLSSDSGEDGTGLTWGPAALWTSGPVGAHDARLATALHRLLGRLPHCLPHAVSCLPGDDGTDNPGLGQCVRRRRLASQGDWGL